MDNYDRPECCLCKKIFDDESMEHNLHISDNPDEPVCVNCNIKIGYKLTALMSLIKIYNDSSFNEFWNQNKEKPFINSMMLIETYEEIPFIRIITSNDIKVIISIQTSYNSESTSKIVMKHYYDYHDDNKFNLVDISLCNINQIINLIRNINKYKSFYQKLSLIDDNEFYI